MHTNSGATALVDSWQFNAMNSVRWKKRLLLLSVSVPWSKVEPNIVTGCLKWSVRLKSQGTGSDAFSPGKKTRFSASPYLKAATDKGKQKWRKLFLFWRWSVFKTVVFLAPLGSWTELTSSFQVSSWLWLIQWNLPCETPPFTEYQNLVPEKCSRNLCICFCINLYWREISIKEKGHFSRSQNSWFLSYLFFHWTKKRIY